MKINLSFDTEHLGDVFASIDWNLPFMPRVGEYLMTSDLPVKIDDTRGDYKESYVEYMKSTSRCYDVNEDINKGILQYIEGYSKINSIYYTSENGDIIPNLMLCSESQYKEDLIELLKNE